MKIKEAIIEWILKDQVEWFEGLSLLERIDPNHFFLRSRDNEINRARLLELLGDALRSGSLDKIDDVVWVKSSEIDTRPPSVDDPTSKQPSSQKPDLPGLNPAARVSMIIHDLIKNRAYYQNKIAKSTSDSDRKEWIQKGDQVSHEITYNRKLLKELKDGVIDDIPEVAEKPGENYSEIPESLYELDQKLRRLRSTRSKTKAKLERMATEGEQNSPSYQQTADKFNQIDEAIGRLEESKQTMMK